MADKITDRSDMSSKLAADITIAWLQNPNVNPGLADVSTLLKSVLSTFNGSSMDALASLPAPVAKAAAAEIAIAVPAAKPAATRTKLPKKAARKAPAGAKAAQAAKETAKSAVMTPTIGKDVPDVVSPTAKPIADQVVTTSSVTKPARAARKAKAVQAETMATPETKGAAPRSKAGKSAANTDAPPKPKTPSKGKAAAKTTPSAAASTTEVAAVDPSGVVLADEQPAPPAAPKKKNGAAKPRRMARAPKADTTLTANLDDPSNEKPVRKAKAPASPAPEGQVRPKQPKRTRKVAVGKV